MCLFLINALPLDLIVADPIKMATYLCVLNQKLSGINVLLRRTIVCVA